MIKEKKEKKLKNDSRHPYMIPEKWIDGEFAFWERGLYTNKSKEYYRNMIDQIIKTNRLKINLIN